MIDINVFTRAIAFAAQAHEGQIRKGSDTPYIVHPMETAAICSTITTDPEILAAAVLHDTVEDTSATIEDIEREFGCRVAFLVAGESENKREDKPAGETWEIRKQEALDHLADADDVAIRIICLGDKLSNIRAMQRDWADKGANLWDRFNQKDPAKHAWYYESIASILEKDLGTTYAWQEYRAIVDAVFANYLPK